MAASCRGLRKYWCLRVSTCRDKLWLCRVSACWATALPRAVRFDRTTSRDPIHSTARSTIDISEKLRPETGWPVRRWSCRGAPESDACRRTIRSLSRSADLRLSRRLIGFGRSSHQTSTLALLTGAHAKIKRPDKRVVARADVLKIDKQNIDILQHFVGSRCSP